jgi:hypothetical protein
VIIQTWLDIYNCEKYPEAQEIADRKIHLYFDDVLQAELYLEMKKIRVPAQYHQENMTT